MSAPKTNVSELKKATREAVERGEEIENTAEFWVGSEDGVTMTAQLMTAYNKRGNIMDEDKAGKAVVDAALEEIVGLVAMRCGWKTTSHTPQGKHFATSIKKQLRTVVAQGLANAGPLKEGYGLNESPADEELGTNGTAASKNGLLAAGDTPESAVDVDQAETHVRKQQMLTRGKLYEDKLRMIDGICLRAHPDHQHTASLMAIRRLLWIFKKAALANNVWDVFGYCINAKLPHDVPQSMRPGSLVKSFAPEQSLPRAFTNGLDDYVSIGWLTSSQVELMYKWLRPAVLAEGVYFLPSDNTSLLDVQETAASKELNLAQLAQLKRDSGTIDTNEQERVFSRKGGALAMPSSTRRVFFYCNPTQCHWITVKGEVTIDNKGKKEGKITIYNSLPQDVSVYQKAIRQFFSVLSAIDNSPFDGIDWMTVPVVAGPCCQQDNSSDCGLITIDNLLDLARGREPALGSEMTSSMRRQGYLESLAQLASESVDQDAHPLSDDDDEDDDGAGADVRLSHMSPAIKSVVNMVAKWTFDHWRFALVQARPDLRNDIAGQRRNLQRIIPSIVTPTSEFGPMKYPPMPNNALPYGSVVWNDDDVASCRPRPDRLPDLVLTYTRQSRPGRVNDVSGQRAYDNYMRTYYPNAPHYVNNEQPGAAPEIRAVHSSNEPFLRATSVGPSRFAYVEYLRELNRILAGLNFPGEKRPLVDVIQLSWDGTTDDIDSFRHIVSEYEHVDIRLSVIHNKPLHLRQPFDGAFTPDHTGRYCWAHYWVKELAQRAAVKNFQGLGLHLDAHNQFVFILNRIRQYKRDCHYVGNAAAHLSWPLETTLTGSHSRTLLGEEGRAKAPEKPVFILASHEYSLVPARQRTEEGRQATRKRALEEAQATQQAIQAKRQRTSTSSLP